MKRIAALFFVAAPLAAQRPDTIIVKADSLVLKQMAAVNGVDTAKARLRIRGDTAWVWYRRDPSYAAGAEFRRVQGRWEPYSSSDTTTAAPARPPGVKPKK